MDLPCGQCFVCTNKYTAKCRPSYCACGGAVACCFVLLRAPKSEAMSTACFDRADLHIARTAWHPRDDREVAAVRGEPLRGLRSDSEGESALVA